MFADGNFSFTITQDIIKSSLINAFIQTLMNIQFFYDLIIYDGDYSSYLDTLTQILKQSEYLKRIAFDKISFSKISTDNIIFHQEDLKKSFNSISFINGCDFTTKKISYFFKRYFKLPRKY